LLQQRSSGASEATCVKKAAPFLKADRKCLTWQKTLEDKENLSETRIANKKTHNELTWSQEQECEEQFERMQQAGGMNSTAQLVGAYVTAEAANFELFNQVAGINTQAAQLQDLIVQQQLLIGRLR